MVKVKFNLRKVAAIVACLAVCMVFSNCGKDGVDGRDGRDGKDGINGVNGVNGTDGKDGINGTNGTNGAQGPQGIPGNAGVMMYVWNDVTFTHDTSFVVPNITSHHDKQFIAYYSDINGTLFPVPHPACDWSVAVFSVIAFDVNTCVYGVMLAHADGTKYLDPITWKSFRVIVVPVPEGNIVEVKSAGKGYPVDWSNYKEVAAYFGLPE